MKKGFYRPVNNENGFTLVEIIIAVSILSFGLLAIATMQVSAITGNSLASDLTEGTMLASEKLETLIRIGTNNYNDSSILDTDGDGDSGLDDTGDNADYHEEQGGYTISWNVSVNSAFTNSKTVEVIATWQIKGSTKRVSIQHIMLQI